MILSVREIAAAIHNGLIRLEPQPPTELWTSMAIDLTLDGVVLLWNPPAAGQAALRPYGVGFNIREITEDAAHTTRISITSGGYPLTPGAFVLGYTKQSIYLPNSSRISARVEGKSSLARLGVGGHVTAPTIHAGFGYNPAKPEEPGLPIQLEIFNLGNQSVILDENMPICQIILEEAREVPTKGYLGKFSEQRGFVADTP